MKKLLLMGSRMLLRIRNSLFTLEDEPNLTRQFMVTLRANLDQVKQHNPSIPKDYLERIEKLFESESTDWSAAYEIERLMIEIYDDTILDTEIGRRLIEAQRSLYPNEYQHYENEYNALKETNNSDKKKALLQRMINDLQWRYSIGQTKRIHVGAIRARTILLFLASIVAFYSFVIVRVINEPLYFTLSSGFLGACFGMLVGLSERLKDKQLEDLRMMRSWGVILARPAIGVGAALIFYYFLYAELLKGGIFPDVSAGLMNFKDSALLIVWSIIAGYSEKFVINLLAKTEEKS